MNILLISSRYLPIFNKDNKGAIQKLEQIYLKFAETTNDRFVVYSPKIAQDNYDRNVFNNTTFRIIDQTKATYKISKYLYTIKRLLMCQPSSEKYIRSVAKDIIKKGEQNKYDLIIFENGEQDVPIFKKMTKTRTRIALHLHNDYVNRSTKNGKKIIESCDEVWVVSGFLAKRVNEVGETKIIIIPNTVDMKGGIDNRSVNSLAKKYDSKNNIIFIFIGRAKKVKGILQLLEAFDDYNHIVQNSILFVIGSTDGGREGKEINKKLEYYTKKNKRIIHLGYLKPEELVKYQMIADCQIIPSVWEEAFGLVVLEAMKSNLRIIASRSGGIPEVGEDAINYVRRESLVRDLIREMKRIDKKAKLPSGYYESLLDKYTVEKYCNNMYNAIHKGRQGHSIK